MASFAQGINRNKSGQDSEVKGREIGKGMRSRGDTKTKCREGSEIEVEVAS